MYAAKQKKTLAVKKNTLFVIPKIENHSESLECLLCGAKFRHQLTLPLQKIVSNYSYHLSSYHRVELDKPGVSAIIEKALAIPFTGSPKHDSEEIIAVTKELNSSKTLHCLLPGNNEFYNEFSEVEGSSDEEIVNHVSRIKDEISPTTLQCIADIPLITSTTDKRRAKVLTGAKKYWLKEAVGIKSKLLEQNWSEPDTTDFQPRISTDMLNKQSTHIKENSPLKNQKLTGKNQRSNPEFPCTSKVGEIVSDKLNAISECASSDGRKPLCDNDEVKIIRILKRLNNMNCQPLEINKTLLSQIKQEPIFGEPVASNMPDGIFDYSTDSKDDIKCNRKVANKNCIINKKLNAKASDIVKQKYNRNPKANIEIEPNQNVTPTIEFDGMPMGWKRYTYHYNSWKKVVIYTSTGLQLYGKKDLKSYCAEQKLNFKQLENIFDVCSGFLTRTRSQKTINLSKEPISYNPTRIAKKKASSINRATRR